MTFEAAAGTAVTTSTLKVEPTFATVRGIYVSIVAREFDGADSDRPVGG